MAVVSHMVANKSRAAIARLIIFIGGAGACLSESTFGGYLGRSRPGYEFTCIVL